VRIILISRSFDIDLRLRPFGYGECEWVFVTITNRQIENGEFGGGLSTTAISELLAADRMMGVDTGRLKASCWRELEAIYAQGLFTNAFRNRSRPTSCTATRRGINVLGQAMMLDYGGPKHD